jgi:predicted nucleotidyltransferase
MRPSEILPEHRETIRQLVSKAGMANPRVFGSVLRGEDTEGSDLDILVDPAPRTSLLDLAGLEMEIEVRTGVKVDLLTPRCLPLKFRQKVLAEAASL